MLWQQHLLKYNIFVGEILCNHTKKDTQYNQSFTDACTYTHMNSVELHLSLGAQILVLVIGVVSLGCFFSPSRQQHPSMT